jgi:hypothetical protein
MHSARVPPKYDRRGSRGDIRLRLSKKSGPLAIAEKGKNNGGDDSYLFFSLRVTN